jgi:hypothetical protein
VAAAAGNGQRWETSGGVGQMGHKSWRASEEKKEGVGQLLWWVGREASWASAEFFPKKQVRLQGMFGLRSDRAAEKIENYF